jgi:hypothetical protein
MVQAMTLIDVKSHKVVVQCGVCRVKKGADVPGITRCLKVTKGRSFIR